MNQLHERALRLVYNNYDLSFDGLLEKDGSFTVHHNKIQVVAIEMFKVYNNLSETIFSDFNKIRITLVEIESFIYLE